MHSTLMCVSALDFFLLFSLHDLRFKRAHMRVTALICESITRCERHADFSSIVHFIRNCEWNACKRNWNICQINAHHSFLYIRSLHGERGACHRTCIVELNTNSSRPIAHNDGEQQQEQQQNCKVKILNAFIAKIAAPWLAKRNMCALSHNNNEKSWTSCLEYYYHYVRWKQ